MEALPPGDVVNPLFIAAFAGTYFAKRLVPGGHQGVDRIEKAAAAGKLLTIVP